MKRLLVRPDALDGAAEIVALAEEYADRFTRYPTARGMTERRPGRFDPYRASEYEEHDRYEVLQGPDMPPRLLRRISAALACHGLPARPYYVQLNRYRAGDYVLPHRDEMPQGLFVLTSSARDGLTVQDGPTFRRIPDRAGTLILADLAAWHWVDPVLDPVRVTLLTIPPPPGLADEEDA